MKKVETTKKAKATGTATTTTATTTATTMADNAVYTAIYAVYAASMAQTTAEQSAKSNKKNAREEADKVINHFGDNWSGLTTTLTAAFAAMDAAGDFGTSSSKEAATQKKLAKLRLARFFHRSFKDANRVLHPDYELKGSATFAIQQTAVKAEKSPLDLAAEFSLAIGGDTAFIAEVLAALEASKRRQEAEAQAAASEMDKAKAATELRDKESRIADLTRAMTACGFAQEEIDEKIAAIG